MTNSGLTLEDAIIMDNVGSSSAGSREIYKIVESLFGSKDGDYFIHTENTHESKKTGKKYRILYIEDHSGRKGSLYFDVTSWS
jgi:hypothetical protein